MKSMRLGGGGRFQKLTGQLRRKGYSKEAADAAAAAIGRRKYGKRKFARLSLSK